MTPQAMAFTAMELGASSLERALVKAFMPPLDAEYAVSKDAPTFPHTEEILSILPECFLSIRGIACLQV